jgi:EF-hand domain pair
MSAIDKRFQSFRRNGMRSIVKAGLVGVLVLGTGLSSALAAPGKGAGKTAEQRFSKLDSNGDGSVTLQEMTGKGKKEAAKIEKRFKKLDKNGDGKVSLAELKGKGKKSNKKSKKNA